MREASRVGRSDVLVPQLGLGTAHLGESFALVREDVAQAVLETAVELDVTLLDMAPYYGMGLSEHRVGRFVRTVDRDRVVIATKVGRVLHPVPRGHSREETFWLGGLNFDARVDYGYDAVLRSHEDSVQRLGLDRVDLLAIHDLDSRHLAARRVRGGTRRARRGWRAGAHRAPRLRHRRGDRPRDQQRRLDPTPRVLELVELDYAIVAMPYTLLDQEALDVDLPLCVERGVSVIVGAVFASGILGVESGTWTYGYEDAPAGVVDRVRSLKAGCERHGVSLPAAALQFPLAHPAVVSVIPGAVTPDQVRENVARLREPIPSALWDELKRGGLLREDAPVPS